MFNLRNQVFILFNSDVNLQFTHVQKSETWFLKTSEPVDIFKSKIEKRVP